MSVLIVGSIALDDIKTPVEEHPNLLGGSASYAAVSASYFSPVNLVGIVGEDFPEEHIDLLKSRRIDLEGLQVVPGKTFRWSGEYMWDMNTRETRSVDLNVFEHFTPTLPASYKSTPFVLLANIAPDLQHHVLEQVVKPRFVIADTMDLWINIAKESLIRLLGRVDMLILNDGEARQLTNQTNLVKAAKSILALGPKYVAIKKGEHGCLLFGAGGEFFSCPAYPLEDIHDPTGAGDTFAGGLAGVLARENDSGPVNFGSLRRAVVFGTVLASFNVEAFSLERLKTVDAAQIEDRSRLLRLMSQFESD
ncbi:MAG: PfkB family carbohydrate kinase [Verrucomicrobia bacterium]|nr:PfkB family carbohydrate kinase [Verrucomicrobiota bacterium]